VGIAHRIMVLVGIAHPTNT